MSPLQLCRSGSGELAPCSIEHLLGDLLVVRLLGGEVELPAPGEDLGERAAGVAVFQVARVQELEIADRPLDAAPILQGRGLQNHAADAAVFDEADTVLVLELVFENRSPAPEPLVFS